MSSLPVQRALYPLLYPLGKVYSFIMSQRRKQYESGEKEQFSPNVPCVAVGNISWGGSGKTPVVSWLLNWAEQEKLTPVVLTRGYKATPPELPYLVTSQSTADDAGDEPVMLAREHATACIVVDPVRKRSGAWAQDYIKPDVVILDDGFQHLAVTRNINLVLLKPEDLTTEWNRVIPSGSWREGSDALSRADAFLIKTNSLHTLSSEVTDKLAHYKVPVFSFSLEPQELVPVTSAAINNDADAKKNNTSDTIAQYVLFSGVGEPAQVEETARAFMGAAPIEHHRFADHHAYTQEDIAEMAKAGLPLVCTPKDAVKVPDVSGVKIWTFLLRTRFGYSMFTDKTFAEWWQSEWHKLTLGE